MTLDSDKNHNNDTPVTFPSSEKILRERIKELAGAAHVSLLLLVKARLDGRVYVF